MSAASTTWDEFASAAREKRVIPVVRELFADTETPVGIYAKLAAGRAGTFLLESAEQGGIWSRFSFVGVSSFGILTERDSLAEWIDLGMDRERALGGSSPLSPLEAVARLHQTWRTVPPPGLPPLTGGLVGFIGWDAVREIENLPDRPPVEVAVPTQGLCFVADLVVVDHRRGTVQLIANVLHDDAAAPEGLWTHAQERLDRMQEGLARDTPSSLSHADFDASADPVARTRAEDFLAAVETSKRHIHDGDVFQVVISQRFELECAAPALDVYRVLRVLNPSPYMYLLTLRHPAGDDFTIVGSSPEALVKVEGGRAITHPIAGSKPRGATPEGDAAYERELRGDAKERAEHLMLVDLARNDLLKVCRAGSVEVTEFMRVERYSHIMHLVSSVEGDLEDGIDAIDVFRAAFPAGTLSGAPKPRALEIIDDLEPAARGVYGGVVGYFGFGGDADLAIAIRTATIVDGVAYVQAGGGLVADSVPQSEYEESRNKAAAPLRAVAVAATLARAT